MANELMNTYTRIPVEFARGEGVKLWSTSGKEYLDFGAGIAVNALGHGHPALVKAVADQAAKLIHTSNYYTTDTATAFAAELVAACSKAGMQKVFLANSGAEANEGAVKIARKYSLVKYGPGRHRVVTLKGSFHGRTITTLAATGQDKFHKDFGPFTEGFVYIESGSMEALKAAFDGTVCALLMEPVQGESGIRPLDPAFVEAAAALCKEHDVLLAFDEIQSGVGRTGSFLACEDFKVEADIVTLAKGLAGGVPIGAVLAGARCAEVLQPGDHGSTFGGNPLAAAAGRAVLKVVTSPAFLADVAKKGAFIKATVEGWKLSCVKEVRAKGLMVGIDIDKAAWPLALAAAEKGLLVLTAGPNTLRLLPPLVITQAELAEGLALLKTILQGEEK